jgi:uncharacterized membrane protein YfcA
MQGDWQPLLAANLAVALGAAVQGTVGYGMNLIAVPLLLSIDASLVPAPLLLAHLLLVVLLTSMDAAFIDRRSLRASTIAAIPGTVLGLAALAWFGHGAFTIFTAAVLIACTALASSRRATDASLTHLLIAGVVSGFCGTTTAINGPPLAAVISRSMPLRQVRATMAAFLLISTLASLAGLAAVGRFNVGSAVLAVSLVPGVLAGIALSRYGLTPAMKGRDPRWLFIAASGAATAIFIGRESWLRWAS